MPIESEIHLVQASTIKGRDDRLRESLDKNHANDLAESIAASSLINPIILEKNTGRLIAGAHRLAAFEINEFLGRHCPNIEYSAWTQIPVRYAYDVTQQELLALELLENIKAKSMDWKEVAIGIAQIHEFQNGEADATIVETGKMLGMNKMTISNNLRAAEYIRNGNDLVLAATSLTGAMNVIQRLEERQFDDIKESIRAGVSLGEALGSPDPVEDWDIPGEPKEILCESEETSSAETKKVSKPFEIIQADFIEWAAQYEGRRFNLIHCDFPYGINYDKSGFDYAKHHSIYGDSKDLYFALLDALCCNSARLVADSAHLIFWYNTRYYSETVALLQDAGWKVWPHHLIWHKSDNAGVLADPRRGPRHTHETALFATRGDRKLVKPVADSWSGPTTRVSGHVSEKPIEMLDHFFTLVCDESTRMLDPTAGSCNSILAARRKGATSGIGIELDGDYARRGNRELEKDDPAKL